MRGLLLWAALGACLSVIAEAHELGSNVKPYSFGADQTIIDINKVVWQPLKLDGLAPGTEISVLRGDLGKGNAEILLRVPAGYKIPNHTHTSDELYVWLSGAFTFIAHDGTRQKFDGPAYISLPGNAAPHGLECGPQASCVFYLRYSRPFDIHYAG